MILSIYTGKPLGVQRNSRAPKSKTPFLRSAFREVERLRTARSGSTIDNYRTALRSFARFLRAVGREDAVLSRLLVEQFDGWLARNGVSANARSCYLRSLRALHSRLKGCGQRANIFSRVFTGNVPTGKRTLSLGAVRKLRITDVGDDAQLQLARDVFMFSVYAMGMPFVDVSQLRWSDLSGGYIVYHRRKTGVEVRVRFEPCMRAIVQRWRGKNGNRFFPLVPHHLEGEAAGRAYRGALNRYNRSLRQLAAKARLRSPLSSYVARHTWATMAYARGMNLSLIASAMGHSNTQTTLIYIAKKDHSKVAKENRKVLNGILGDVSDSHKHSFDGENTSFKEVYSD